MDIGGPPTGEIRSTMVNPWTLGRVPGLPVHPPLGAWQSRRTLASAAFVPPQWVRASLKGAKAFWYQFPQLTLDSAQSDLTGISTSEDFWLMIVMAQTSQAIAGGSIRFLIYEDINGYKQAKYGINQANGAPSAKEPMLQRMVHFIEAGSPVNCRVQNLAAATNIVNLCMFGYTGLWRK